MKEKPEEIYIRLRDRMNSLAFGYGPTKSGVEFSLLKRFFTPEDAAHVLEMEIEKYFTAQDYARVSGRKAAEAEKILEDLCQKGLIFRKRRDGEPNTYRVVPVAHGFYEFNVGNVEKDIKENKADYLSDNETHTAEAWGKQWYGNTEIPFFRSIPINSDVVAGSEVLPFDDATDLIKSKRLFAVSKCLCRISTAASGKTDDPRKEVCLAFDDMARFYIDIGIGREITMQNALELIQESVKQGLCLQVANSKDAEVMCSCSPESCGLLKMNKAFGGMATKYISHYRVKIDREKCVGCGTCVAKCSAQICSVDEQTGKSITDYDHCVGCGQCVRRCVHEARALVKKNDDEILPLQDTLFDAYDRMGTIRRERGKI